MAEQLQLVAKLVLDSGGADQDIKKLTTSLEKVKEVEQEIVALYGQQSAEAKEAAAAVAQIEGNLSKAKASGEGIDQPIRSIKQQLKEANVELQNTVEKFGIGSKEAANAAAKVAKLKDTIGDAKTLTDAFNPDAKFKGLGNAIQGAAGAFTALQGAQAIFGEESKQVQETLLKVQGALALSQGVNSILEAGDSFKALGSSAKTALAGIKTGIAATGIGVLLIALGAIVAYWDDIKGAVSGVSSEQKKLNEDSKKNLQTQEDKLSAIEGQEQQLKAQGKSEREILQIKLKQTDAAIQAAEVNLENAKATKTAQVEAAERNQTILKGFLNFLTAPISALLAGVDLLTSGLNKAGIISDETFKSVGNLRDKFTGGIASLVFDPKKEGEEGDKAIKEAEKGLNALKEKRAGFQNGIASIDKAAAEKRKAQAEKDAEAEKQLQEKILKDREDRAKRAGDRQAEIDKQVQANRLAAIEDGEFKERLLLDTQLDERIAGILKSGEDEVAALNESLKNKLITQEEYNAATAALDEQLKAQREGIEEEYQKGVDAITLRYQQKRANEQAQYEQSENERRINSLSDGFVKQQELLQLQQQKEIDALLEKLNNKEIDEDEYNRRRLTLEQKFQNELSTIKFNNALKDVDDTIKNNELNFNAQKDANDREKVLLEQRIKDQGDADGKLTEALKNNAEARRRINQAEIKARLETAKQFGQVLNNISELVGKNTKAGKAAAISGLVIQQAVSVAETVTNTIKASRAIASKYAGVPGGFIPAGIEIALNVTQGALAVKNAISTVKKGIKEIQGASESSAGGGGGGADLGGAGPGGGAPIPPQPETTTIDQGQVNQLASSNAAVRAYVVETDVSGAQDRITRINRAARIG